MGLRTATEEFCRVTFPACWRQLRSAPTSRCQQARTTIPARLLVQLEQESGRSRSTVAQQQIVARADRVAGWHCTRDHLHRKTCR